MIFKKKYRTLGFCHNCESYQYINAPKGVLNKDFFKEVKECPVCGCKTITREKFPYPLSLK